MAIAVVSVANLCKGEYSADASIPTNMSNTDYSDKPNVDMDVLAIHGNANVMLRR